MLLEKEGEDASDACVRNLVFSTALIGSSAYSADNPAVPKDQPPQAQAPLGVSFVTGQEKRSGARRNLWESAFYGPDDKQIGKIDDLLMDRNGAAQTVVIGAGGFLGFGKKDIAAPFSTMRWRAEARKFPATDQQPANPAAPNGQPPATKETDPAATEASQEYPDKAILNVTLAELKAAPEFKYAVSPLAKSDTRPAGARTK